MSSNQISALLYKNQWIAGRYQIVFFVRANKHIQSYRLADEHGATCMLHLVTDSTFSTQQKENYCALRAKLTGSLFPKFYAMASELIENDKYFYIIEEFKTGESLLDRIKRSAQLSSYFADHFLENILKKLIELHSQLPELIFFNTINPANIWIDMSEQTEAFCFVDFLSAQFEDKPSALRIDENNFCYQATELLETHKGSVSADLFSLAVIYYQLTYGKLPWRLPMPQNFATVEDWLNEVKKIRAKGIEKPPLTDIIEEKRFLIISKALAQEPVKRFASAKRFLHALKNMETFEQDNSEVNQKTDIDDKAFGFNAIAGMDELKRSFQTDVIDAIKNKDKYKQYGLAVLNGVLLYGPPGCGKTFFAEKLAEEIAFSFFRVKPSDLQSKYINESQEKIKNLFDKAKEQSPAIIFIDEIDAIAPSRAGNNMHHMYASAVNELLVQMNNCGQAQILVVAATNIPENIDPALLRTGRLDKKIFISTPDKQSRIKLFSKMLEDRPLKENINYHLLAERTENRVASDIKFICDQASRKALVDNRLIAEKDLLDAIAEFSASHF